MNAQTGEKYHVTTKEYYRQIRAISDRLCREHGLSVIMEGQPSQSVSYIEWLRQYKGQPTFRSMLEADLRSAIEDANDLGHFFMLMEHMGYEISHGSRLGFRLRGQERFMYPGRKNLLFTEDGIQAAIQGNLEAIESGNRPAVVYRVPYKPYQKHPKYSGLMALYVHYLYVLGKIEKRQYPPRMTPRLRKEVMRAKRYREQFAFLRDNGISTQEDMAAFQTRTEDMLAALTKQRTIFNVRKKKRRNSVHNKSSVRSFKLKKQTRNPVSEWVRVEGTHEAIINKDIFDQIQQQITCRRRQRKDGTTQIFAGLVRCADCGWAMHFARQNKGSRPGYYFCGTYSKKVDECTMHFISYNTLYTCRFRSSSPRQADKSGLDGLQTDK